jgi:hypothetical protein
MTLNQVVNMMMRTTRETDWHDIQIPAGSICTIESSTRWDELRVIFAPCAHCGTRWRARIPAVYLTPVFS